MKSNSYIKFTDEQLSKLGNSIIYLYKKTPNLSKTKGLKLLYISDLLYSHRVNSPWYNTAKENLVLDLIESKKVNTTEFVIDLGKLVEHNPRKMDGYNQFQEAN